MLTFRRCCLAGLLLLAPACAPQQHSVADPPLLDVLRQRRVLTQEDYERLRNTEISPTERAGLIELLHQRRVLSDEDVKQLQAGMIAPAAPIAPPAPAASPARVIEAPRAGGTASQMGYDDGLFVRSADGKFSLRLNGRVAANFLFFEPGTAQNNSETIDRARLSADATFYQYFRLRIENDFAYRSGLRDAYLAATPLPELNIQIGQFKVPFSYEELLDKQYTDFVERSAVVTNTVNPSRDIGVMLYGQLTKDVLQYQLAVMNGAGQNRGDNNNDKDLIARAVVSPFVFSDWEHLRGLNLGAAVTYGHQPGETASGATTTKSSTVGATETGFTFFPGISRHGERLRVGEHIAWFDGPYSLSAEYIHTREERANTDGSELPDLHSDGGYIGGTWMITGEDKTFNARVRPADPLIDFQNPGWGAWEAALRYEFFKLRHDPDSLVIVPSDLNDNRYDGITAGMNWYPNEFLRVSLNYLYGRFDHVGHFANPDTVASPDPEKHSNNAVLARVQLEF